MRPHLTELLDAIALQQAAHDAGITLVQARRFAAALGELQGQQMARIVGDAARIESCGRQRRNAKEARR